MEKALKYYKNLKGKAPFIQWLESIKDKVTRAKIQTRINRMVLKNYGDYKSVGEGVMELRIHYGAGYRIYFAEENNEIILLLLGGNKHNQNNDIQKAHEYWRDFKERTNA